VLVCSFALLLFIQSIAHAIVMLANVAKMTGESMRERERWEKGWKVRVNLEGGGGRGEQRQE
jgi:hypothetical protein